MDTTYSLSKVKNSVIRFHWIRLGLRAKWEVAIPMAVQMVTEQGRVKLLRPIYRRVCACECVLLQQHEKAFFMQQII